VVVGPSDAHERIRIALDPRQLVAQRASREIIRAYRRDERARRPGGRHVLGNVRGTAKSERPRSNAHDWYRRLGGDAIHIPSKVDIEHGVSRRSRRAGLGRHRAGHPGEIAR
jgi:hypothetical protein